MSVDVYEFADVIGERLKDRQEFVFKELRRELNANGEINIDLIYSRAVTQLELDGYINRQPDLSKYYVTGIGQTFIRKGGYAFRHREDERVKKMYEDQILTTIKTNESVQKTNTISKRSMWVSGIISLLSLIFIALSYLKPESAELSKLRSETESLSLTVRKMQSNLAGLDSAFRAIRSDTTFRTK